ncbi:MAG: BlaI/MecI/CopY family transcriptional regulator [Acidobacteria bacterium]|nr:BlaI/MecI/CopY family transcriptional regulator [Acidobacteriota bacterium]NIM61386.1 BlaI/MecI/CopY family transcriptional regulator [Acidobacteriota bacterium]NIO58070.1 BlaI/MecI/CopY family transcriptional regulator [Acidobacteriota bacterium]NIQ29079.1 BlaI/MecI/CopY family transcriptional regulator [Acidobacteriota bacterium]NIQ83623.1 BlaI/MecI/CopY family transcriptional regulator [Acidobacteriota bacterium]
MSRPKHDVTDAELAVLKELWALGPSTIRELTDRLYPGGATAHYATVQKLLERLEAKRCVKRRGRGRANEYRAVVEVTDLIDHTLRGAAARLCGGSLAPLLTHLVNTTQPDAAQVEELKRLVKRLDRQGGSA